MKHEGLAVISFKDRDELHHWLVKHHDTSSGIWLRLYKVKSKQQTVTFKDVLEEGLCFGWSESLRHTYDQQSYLQKFTPRKTKGTASARNRSLADKLIQEKRMKAAGLEALGLTKKDLTND